MTQGTSRPDPADPTLPLDPEEDAAWRALARAVIVVPRVLDADLIEGAGLNLAEYIALVELSEAPGRALRMSELAALTDLSRSGLSRLIERLVRQGLVSREPFADDGRGRVAQLTEAGLRRLEQAYPHALASVRRNVMQHLACLDLAAFAEAVGNFAPDDAYAPARRTTRLDPGYSNTSVASELASGFRLSLAPVARSPGKARSARDNRTRAKVLSVPASGTF